MALGSKTSTKFFATSGGGGDEINSTRKTDLEAIATSEASEGSKNLINDPTLGPLVLNIQRMQDDLDELRRFVAAGNEIKTVIGNPLAIADGGTGLAASQPLIYSKITISSGEMASLNSTRKTLLAAPGPDKIIVPVSIIILCNKLNGSVANSTLTTLFGGYYHNDNRDVTRAPSHQVLGLLYNQRSAGSYHINPVSSMFSQPADIVDKEFALALSVAPGASGATTSEVLFCYYIADVS